MRILVVDDNTGHLQTARDQFPDDEITELDSYEQAIKALELVEGKPYFDLALFDLLMPAERYALGNRSMKFFGHEMPVGLVLVLLAALAGVPQVICITDASHHDHPMSAILDFIRPAYWKEGGQHYFRINDSKCFIGHAPMNGDGKDWREAYLELDS
jgi:CheY-like chemotaxis protein